MTRAAMRWLSPVAALASVVLLAACPGVKPIKELLDDPSRYQGETVRVAGEVTESVGALGIGGYQVNDGTRTLTVVLKSGGAPPRVGAKVGRRGHLPVGLHVGDPDRRRVDRKGPPGGVSRSPRRAHRR